MKFSARKDIFSATKLQILKTLQYPLTVLPTTNKSASIQTHLEKRVYVNAGVKKNIDYLCFQVNGALRCYFRNQLQI